MTGHAATTAIHTETASAIATAVGARVAPLPQAEGTTALESLASQAVVWGLVVAAAMVVVCAAWWAIGSAASHPQAGARAKSGILVALIGALLLGAGQGYLAWLRGGQAQAFTADPASYRAETAAPKPGIEVIDKTADWIDAINHYRRTTPAADTRSDPGLASLAASCASKIAAGQGICPNSGQYYEVKLSPSQIGTLSGPLTAEAIAREAPMLTHDVSRLTADPRIALVGARNTHNGAAALVIMVGAGPCPPPCMPASDGDLMPRILAHIIMPG